MGCGALTMRTRNIKLRPLRGEQHSTASGAIAFAENYHRDRLPPDEHRVVAKPISAVNYTDDAFTLRVGDASLLVSKSGSQLVYRIVDAGRAIADVATEDAVTLNFDGVAHRWDRRKVSQVLIGRELMKIFVTPDFLYLYFTEVGIVAVCVETDADTQAPFLYWDFSQ